MQQHQQQPALLMQALGRVLLMRQILVQQKRMQMWMQSSRLSRPPCLASAKPRPLAAAKQLQPQLQLTLPVTMLTPPARLARQALLLSGGGSLQLRKLETRQKSRLRARLSRNRKVARARQRLLLPSR